MWVPADAQVYLVLHILAEAGCMSRSRLESASALGEERVRDILTSLQGEGLIRVSQRRVAIIEEGRGLLDRIPVTVVAADGGPDRPAPVAAVRVRRPGGGPLDPDRVREVALKAGAKDVTVVVAHGSGIEVAVGSVSEPLSSAAEDLSSAMDDGDILVVTGGEGHPHALLAALSVALGLV